MPKTLQALLHDISHFQPRRLALPLAALLLAIGLAACSTASESGREGGGEGAETGEVGGEGPGEHGEGGEGSESGGEGGEESGVGIDLGVTYDRVRNGARLILRYDAASETFRGTVTNTTAATLTQVRVEVHLRPSGPELGPTEPRDLAPGETIMVNLDATGQNFTQYSPHSETGTPSSPVDPAGTSIFTPALAGWAVIGGVDVGIEHTGHGMSARHEWLNGAWTSRLSPDPAPGHQPTGAATWSGAWVGYHGSSPAIATGDASVRVTLGTGGNGATEADLTLEDVPVLGTLAWDDLPVTGGRFTGSTTANSQAYDATGQFAGPNQAGVVGHATGPEFRSVFYGDKD